MSIESGFAGDAVTWRPELAVGTCDHDVPADWRLQSEHTTSVGTVEYARCACGAWLILLDGERLATVDQPRPRARRPLGGAPSSEASAGSRLRNEPHGPSVADVAAGLVLIGVLVAILMAVV
jgi:hypothetical protein